MFRSGASEGASGNLEASCPEYSPGTGEVKVLSCGLSDLSNASRRSLGERCPSWRDNGENVGESGEYKLVPSWLLPYNLELEELESFSGVGRLRRLPKPKSDRGGCDMVLVEEDEWFTSLSARMVSARVELDCLGRNTD